MSVVSFVRLHDYGDDDDDDDGNDYGDGDDDDDGDGDDDDDGNDYGDDDDDDLRAGIMALCKSVAIFAQPGPGAF